MIDQDTVERIMSAADIVSVVSDYVSLRRSGTSYVGLCPFHDDKHPSFSVSPAKGLCKCFSCGKGGNVVHFLMEVEQISYYDALRKLAAKYGIDVQERELSADERRTQSEREGLYALNEWACQHFHHNLLNHDDGRAIGLAYFRSRGLRDDMIERFRLGYCLDQWDAFSKEALRKGYRREFLTATGLSTQRNDGSLLDKFRGRAIFPWLNVSGKVVAFGGRVLDQRTKGVAQKYVNSPDSAIFHKSNELYGIFQAKRQIAREDHVFMVEGYTDVIAMHQCGVENVVANSGTALNIAQIRLLRRFTQNITLIYDGDEAGIHAALRGTDMLLAEGMNVRVLLLPEGNDPDSFAQQHNASELRDYVAQHATDFIAFKAGLITDAEAADPRQRSKLANSILQSICVIPDEIVRSTYVHQCATQLRMDERMLLRTCNKLRKEFLDKRRQEREQEKARQERLSTPPAPPTNKETTPAPAGQGAPDATGTAAPPAPPQEHDSKENKAQGEETPKIVQLERLIMQEVVRYGEQPIPYVDTEGNEQEATVAQYVINDLDMDGLTLQQPIYAQMLQILRTEKPAGPIAHFFSTYPQPDISHEAEDLRTERYKLSRRFVLSSEQETAPQRIVHLMYDYKFLCIENLINSLRQQLSPPPADNQQVLNILQDIARLTQLKRMIGERLGEKLM